ncbi:hypothetical protein STANM309S_02492 [Streptomyces tanashiensis]
MGSRPMRSPWSVRTCPAKAWYVEIRGSPGGRAGSMTSASASRVRPLVGVSSSMSLTIFFRSQKLSSSSPAPEGIFIQRPLTALAISSEPPSSPVPDDQKASSPFM